MPNVDSPFSPGTPCWADLLSSDPVTAKAFYSAIFGWTWEDSSPEFGGYVNFSTGGRMIAGMMINDGEKGIPDQWSIYLASADTDASLAAATGKGAQVVVPRMDVADLGAMSMIVDPVGAGVGMWEAGTHNGFGVVGEPGSPCWHENHTRDFAGTTGFYSDVFGWGLRVEGATPEFTYSIGTVGDVDVVGIMDASSWLPESTPSQWQTYWGVANIDETVSVVVELGGTVLESPEDTPYGRLAKCADPTGATFKLMTPPTAA